MLRKPYSCRKIHGRQGYWQFESRQDIRGHPLRSPESSIRPIVIWNSAGFTTVLGKYAEVDPSAVIGVNGGGFRTVGMVFGTELTDSLNKGSFQLSPFFVMISTDNPWMKAVSNSSLSSGLPEPDPHGPAGKLLLLHPPYDIGGICQKNKEQKQNSRCYCFFTVLFIYFHLRHFRFRPCSRASSSVMISCVIPAPAAC